jgi:hypothetical protein
MTCRDAAGLVAEAGAITMNTGKNTYQRFYVTGTNAAFVQTLDKAACFIGYVRLNNGQDHSAKYYKDSNVVCKEGKVEQVNQRDRGDVFFKPVYRTCVNGKWVIPGYNAYPAVTKCKEGRMGYITQGLDSRGEPNNIPAVCHNGKYIPLY